MVKANKDHLEGTEAFEAPLIPDGEKLTFSIEMEGGGEQFLGDIRAGFRMDSEFRTFEYVKEEGMDVYALTSTGTQLNGNKTVTRFLISREAFPKALSQHYHEETPDGVVVEDRRLNLESILAPFPPGTFPGYLMSYYARALVNLGDRTASLIAWTDRMQVVPFTAKFTKQEEITVPAGTFMCDVIEFETDLGQMMPGNKMMAMMGKFMSNALTFWRTQDDDRQIVQTRTPTGPPSSPTMVLTLTDIENG